MAQARSVGEPMRGSASPLPPDVTSRQRPQTFRELVADLYMHCVRLRGLSRLLALLGCGVGAATLWRDVQVVAPGRAPDPQAKLPLWVGVDGTWLFLGGAKQPVAAVLGPKGERLDLRLSGPGCDWPAGSRVWPRAGCGADDPVYGPALETVGLVAAMRKLLVMLNAIMRDQVPRQREPVTKSLHT